MSMPGGYLALLSMVAAGAFVKARNDRKARLRETTHYPTPAPDPAVDNGNGAYYPPQPPTGLDCSSWQPVIIPPHGTVGFWVDDGQGSCKLQCKEGWTVTPDGKGCLQPPDPATPPGPPPTTPTQPPTIPGSIQPGEGPNPQGSCVENFVYSQTPSKPSPQLMFELDTPTGALAQNVWLYMLPGLDQQVFNAIRSRLVSADRTLPTVAVRDILQEFIPTCNFYGPLHPAEQKLYESGLALAELAMSQIGWRPGMDPDAHLLMKTPGTTTGPALVARDWLGFTADNAQNIQPDQRVELLVGEYLGPSNESHAGFPYAENVIARVTSVDPQSQTFEVQVIDQFMGDDRTPKLSAKHHYSLGTNLKLNMQSPTGLRRIYQTGLV